MPPGTPCAFYLTIALITQKLFDAGSPIPRFNHQNLFREALLKMIEGSIMFNPQDEAVVIEIVRDFFQIPSDEMRQIGDQTRQLLFEPGRIDSEEAAVERVKIALRDMPKEHAVIMGVFISGFIRCDLAQHRTQTCVPPEDDVPTGASDR